MKVTEKLSLKHDRAAVCVTAFAVVWPEVTTSSSLAAAPNWASRRVRFNVLWFYDQLRVCNHCLFAFIEYYIFERFLLSLIGEHMQADGKITAVKNTTDDSEFRCWDETTEFTKLLLNIWKQTGETTQNETECNMINKQKHVENKVRAAVFVTECVTVWLREETTGFILVKEPNWWYKLVRRRFLYYFMIYIFVSLKLNLGCRREVKWTHL